MFDNLSPRAQSLLEQALQGESDTVKARVLQLVLESGINPEEEFFLISLGLNHLKVLLLQTPEQLQSWSEGLQETLDAWSGSYGQLLGVIAQKAEATNALTETAGQLSTMLTSHTHSSNALIKQLQMSYQQQGETWDQQAAFNNGLEASLQTMTVASAEQTTQLADQLKALGTEVRQANRPNPLAALGLTPDRGWKQAVFYGTAMTLTTGAIAVTMMATFYLRDRALQRSTARKVEYLLQKQNRRDCLDGIKAVDSVECRQ